MPTPPTKINVIITSNDTHIILEARTQNGQRLEVLAKGDGVNSKLGDTVLDFTKPKQPVVASPTPTEGT